ncbi:acyl-CoA desaturase [Curtobacterium sp. VKM Ac-2922]|uniref:fatty acid desaturase family protein n=1 Tax=Curtobacterium sp. VKM Ac-2922 TaxID=2929475 RepID=UPI0027E30A9E|nr:acyl-CoA desaturase [Curtobacterium sp. VKM Ac-2922]
MTTELPLSTQAPAARPYRSTGPGDGKRTGGTSTYAALLAQVKDAGLLRRRRGFYWSMFAGLVVALAACWVAFAMLGDSWFQLIVAGALGIIFTQFAFLSHELAHRQVFESRKWNDRAGRGLGTFVVGLSYSWWMNKHTRHHGNPNTVGKDPDIAPDGVVFIPEDAAKVTGPMRAVIRHQGWLFFPLLTLEGINLHRHAVVSVLRGADGRPDPRGRITEGVLLVARFAIYLTVVFWFLPFGMACAFLGVQLAVFGVMMGASFAPNHKGMPTIAHDAKVDFFSRQVRTSRNIRGGWWVSFLMGGLNYQVEHHLFPSMPRPALRQARDLVRAHCDTLDVPYTETTLLRSYGIVVRYLNRVGLSARDPFDCPMVTELRIN